ncbi:hypothetical protein [Actinokineospora iranica]|nr:hypothetical protein [Actinokineospora iranica]
MMVLASGCGGAAGDKRYPLPEYYPTPTFRDAFKYSTDTFTGCPDLQQKVPDLPSPLQKENNKHGVGISLTCTFVGEGGLDERFITFHGEVRGFTHNPGLFSGSEKDTTVNIGSDARWRPAGTDSMCTLEVLDENAFMVTGFRDEDPQSERCRESAREIARKIYAAVQPE